MSNTPVTRNPAALLAAVLLVLALALGSLAAPPAAAQPPGGWVPLEEATIHPGVQTVTAGGQCTANFVFTDDAGGVYLGQAAHCGSDDSSSETDGCIAEPPPLGTAVSIDGATQPGVLVYSSWATMQAVGEQAANPCRYNDLALVAIHPDDVARVNPSLPHFGGPTGIVGLTADGDPVHTYGNSGLRPGGGAQKSGTSAGQAGDGWTHRVRTTANPGIPGDSGSAFVDGQGRAFGVLSTLEVFPNIGANGVSDLSRMLDYMLANGGPAVALELGTVAFSPTGTGTDQATGQPDDADPVTRLAGDSRVQTAVQASRDLFGGLSAGAVVLARADVAADALAGTALAAGARGPLLLTGPSSLHPDTRDEIRRVLLPGLVVYVLGGPNAIGGSVEAELTADGYTVRRLSGPSRIETAIAVADVVTPAPAEILLADGRAFADALVAGPAAHSVRGVVVLTDGPRAHPAVDAYLADHPDVPVTTVGATASAAYPGRRSLSGDDDVATSTLVATAYLEQATTVGVARVDVFADALAGGAHAAQRGGPMLLTESGRLSEDAAGHLRARADRIDAAYLYGGTAALAEQVAADVRAALAG